MVAQQKCQFFDKIAEMRQTTIDQSKELRTLKAERAIDRQIQQDLLDRLKASEREKYSLISKHAKETSNSIKATNLDVGRQVKG